MDDLCLAGGGPAHIPCLCPQAVKRHGWRRRTDNRGIVWVHVPHMQAEPAPHLAQAKPGQVGDVQAFARALDALTEGHAREMATKDALIVELRAAVTRATLDAETAEAAARAAHDRLAEVQRDRDAEKARGRWARLRAAWLGQ